MRSALLLLVCWSLCTSGCCFSCCPQLPYAPSSSSSSSDSETPSLIDHLCNLFSSRKNRIHPVASSSDSDDTSAETLSAGSVRMSLDSVKSVSFDHLQNVDEAEEKQQEKQVDQKRVAFPQANFLAPFDDINVSESREFPPSLLSSIASSLSSIPLSDSLNAVEVLPSVTKVNLHFSDLTRALHAGDEEITETLIGDSKCRYFTSTHAMKLINLIINHEIARIPRLETFFLSFLPDFIARTVPEDYVQYMMALIMNRTVPEKFFMASLSHVSLLCDQNVSDIITVITSMKQNLIVKRGPNPEHTSYTLFLEYFFALIIAIPDVIDHDLLHRTVNIEGEQNLAAIFEFYRVMMVMILNQPMNFYREFMRWSAACQDMLVPRRILFKIVNVALKQSKFNNLLRGDSEKAIFPAIIKDEFIPWLDEADRIAYRHSPDKLENRLLALMIRYDLDFLLDASLRVPRLEKRTDIFWCILLMDAVRNVRPQCLLALLDYLAETGEIKEIDLKAIPSLRLRLLVEAYLSFEPLVQLDLPDPFIPLDNEQPNILRPTVIKWTPPSILSDPDFAEELDCEDVILIPGCFLHRVFNIPRERIIVIGDYTEAPDPDELVMIINFWLERLAALESCRTAFVVELESS